MLAASLLPFRTGALGRQLRRYGSKEQLQLIKSLHPLQLTRKLYPILHTTHRGQPRLAKAAMSTVASPATTTVIDGVTHLGQHEAIAVDEELMGPLGFSVDQLMELAGLSVACAVASEYSRSSFARVLIMCGPGNNGGDGLVAGRHLHHFGYSVTIVYPKRTDKALYNGLVTQLQCLGIPFMETDEVLQGPLSEQFDLVIDAMFGFSFKGAPRPPFDAILRALSPSAQPPPVISVDIPSGWHVEQGPCEGALEPLQPDMLVSLTAPKLAAQHFKGRYHYLGGRFVPPAIMDRFNLQLPAYPGAAQCVRIGTGANSGKRPADMRMSYGEGGAGLLESDVDVDPIKQFRRWFEEASASSLQEPNAMTIATAAVEQATEAEHSTVSGLRVIPSARTVLLKGFDARGFVFYTNYNSRKGRELDALGQAALVFWWEPLQKAVRVEGTVERVPPAESDEYFNSRPRSSRIGALVSQQSAVLKDGRMQLEQRAAELQEEYASESVPIPRPEHWGGYLVRPAKIEFWQGRPSRLHDRLLYSKQGDGSWTLSRLSP